MRLDWLSWWNTNLRLDWLRWWNTDLRLDWLRWWNTDVRLDWLRWWNTDVRQDWLTWWNIYLRLEWLSYEWSPVHVLRCFIVLTLPPMKLLVHLSSLQRHHVATSHVLTPCLVTHLSGHGTYDLDLPLLHYVPHHPLNIQEMCKKSAIRDNLKFSVKWLGFFHSIFNSITFISISDRSHTRVQMTISVQSSV